VRETGAESGKRIVIGVERRSLAGAALDDCWPITFGEHRKQKLAGRQKPGRRSIFPKGSLVLTEARHIASGLLACRCPAKEELRSIDPGGRN